MPISFYHYLLTYQEGEEGGGSQVGACASWEFQPILGLLLEQIVGKKAQGKRGLGSFTEGAPEEKVGSNSHPTSHPLRGAFHRTVCSPIIKQDHLLANQDPHHVLSKPG